MKLEQSSINGIKFYHRPNFSDLKTFQEVLLKKDYLKRGMKIIKDESWMDCGGNVGAFTLLACKAGATVTVFEPDPYNCEMIEKNLKLNNFSSQAEIKQVALVHDERKETSLFIGTRGNVWRNSIVKSKWKSKWEQIWNDRGNGKALKVPCINFDQASENFDYCKMDIEGAEMSILENTKKVFKKLVYEWSFDVDPNTPRLWDLADKQKEVYRVETSWSSMKYRTEHVIWQESWFPACCLVFCFKK
tara:strand:+ start:291 stop:1028 length:738 start_codon:yes stop_codon:yes gene_type:complete